jgi:hypothetical protein
LAIDGAIQILRKGPIRLHGQDGSGEAAAKAGRRPDELDFASNRRNQFFASKGRKKPARETAPAFYRRSGAFLVVLDFLEIGVDHIFLSLGLVTGPGAGLFSLVHGLAQLH